ncbi:MAG TPA: type IV secretion system DNA-binding domain-containing protein [Verrucomicrobiota bacterium]|nr:hypothetical protein [Verrucomicrobiales bacterium]HRI12777.1 type IV secretion system DNA-binding domain-containing protein [Verrucomicrobiota bacterium]
METYFAAVKNLLRPSVRDVQSAIRGEGLGGIASASEGRRVSAASLLSPRLIPQEATRYFEHHGLLRPAPPSRPYWGGVELLSDDAVLHFGVSGCTGSGKTIEILQLIQSVLTGLLPDEDRRALIYDAKRDLYPFFHALGLSPLVYNLNPFDRRGVAWDLAQDIVSAAEIEQFASIVIPANPNEHNPFFTDASRILLRCAIVALQTQCPGQWSLRDVVLTVSNPERLRSLLSLNAETKEIGENFFRAREFPSVMSTIETKVRPLHVVAALWDKAPRKISLQKHWLERGAIILLPYHPSYSYALDPINRAIFRYLSDAMLALPKSVSRRSWVILDEVREAGKLDGLRKLLTQGREKGVCVVLGFQDIDGMREVYGKEGANELLGECNHKTFLRTDNPATADWMVSHVNKALIRSRQIGKDRDGRLTTTDSLKIDGTMLAADFLGIPVTSAQFGLKSFHLSSRIPKPYWAHRPLQSILSRLPVIRRDIPGEDPRPKADQEMRPWSPEDSARLRLPKLAPEMVSADDVVDSEPPLRAFMPTPPRPESESADAADNPAPASSLLWTTGPLRPKKVSRWNCS